MADIEERSRSPRRSPSSPHKRRDRSPSPRRRRDDERRTSRSPRRHDDNNNNNNNDKKRSRSRSRSPPRSKPADFGKAFKWKSKGDREERDYRRRDDDNYRPRRYGGKDDRDRRNDRERDRERRDGGDSKIADKFGRAGTAAVDRVADKFGGGAAQDKSKDKPKPKPAAVAAAPATYILVTVNDRLGTKATIPCLASDTVGDFKKMVAAHVGRQPHEIMLKRQGERPFKDFITLGDYGVSNGVQLDLELDTGD